MGDIYKEKCDEYTTVNDELVKCNEETNHGMFPGIVPKFSLRDHFMDIGRKHLLVFILSNCSISD
jgi:hypothetical protein